MEKLSDNQDTEEYKFECDPIPSSKISFCPEGKARREVTMASGKWPQIPER